MTQSFNPYASGEPPKGPAEEGAGIRFVRADLPGRPSIPASVSHVSDAPRRTVLTAEGARVETVEHCLGALAGMRLASFSTRFLPAEFPIETDLKVWAIAGISVVVLTVLVGVPPALHALRIKIVDALAGR